MNEVGRAFLYALLTLVSLATPVSAQLLINAGGSATGGYVADRHFTDGRAYTFRNQSGVYNTERWSTTSFSYAIPVTPGQVEVTLRFRESCTWCTLRSFRVDAEGQVVLANHSAPPNTVADRTFIVTTDATLNLVFTRLVGEAWVNAIEVRPLGSSAPPSLTFSATPASVSVGNASTLNWSSANATTCTASGGWSGAQPTTGSQSTGPLASTRTFGLSCSGSGGTIIRSATVTVAPDPAPSVTLVATPPKVASGAAATLSWTSTNATACTATGGWTGARALNGSASSGALTAATLFAITCTGTGGSQTESVTVAVAQAPTLLLTASPSTVSSGAPATLSWTSTDATACTATGGWTGARALNGSASTGALTASTTFILTCTGAGGSASASATVDVAASIAPLLINAGGSATGGYVADRRFTGGRAYAFGNQSGVYNTERWSTTSFSYAIPVTPGQVEVTLRFRESCTWCTTRSFRVDAEGQVVLANHSAPPNTVADRTFIVATDATLDLAFTRLVGEAWVNAIEVRHLGSNAPPSLTFSAMPTSVSVGNASTLNWSSANATTCTASGGWSGAQALTGSATTGALTATTLFTMTCTGPGGSASASATVSVAGSSASRFPLHVEAGKRYLVDVNGAPFLIHGDTPWSLIVQLSRADVDLYLENRRQKGFNAVLVNLIEHSFATSPPDNVYGEPPFLVPGDFSTPNEAYFAHADYVIAKAAEKGILVLLTPAYMGFGGGSQGWYQEMQSNGTAKLRAYGQYVANRFLPHDNILWVHGGDYNPPERDLMRAVVDGIRDVDGRWLHTFHGARGTAALPFLGPGEPWLQVNNIYTALNTVIASAFQEYARSTMPFFLIEGEYESDGATAPGVRQQAYQAVLSGGSGQLMGNASVWNMLDNSWRLEMDSAGARTLTHLRTLLESRSWSDLQPDVSNVLLTGGIETGASRAAAALTSDRSYALIYTPSVRTLTLDLGQFAGPNVATRWYDPTTGAYAAIAGSPVAAGGIWTFTPSGSNAGGAGDWVLVLESVP